MADRIPTQMAAVHTTGHGGFEKLVYRTDVTVPSPGPGEVLMRVLAAGVNNTDVNTRIGWYSKTVTDATNDGGAGGFDDSVGEDGGWSGALSFPRIQGADACGRIVAVGAGVDAVRIGERVLVATMQRNIPQSHPMDCWTFGSECDGAFAQYTVARSHHTYKVDCGLSDIELASFPCAYSTAENMLHRSGVGASDTVLITGASGGVGSAAIQLAKRRGSQVIAVASRAKWADVESLGADRMLDREADLVAELGADSIDVAVDLVAGPKFPELLDVLRPGGRYVTSGAIAGPIVDLDVRSLYLKDLTFHGCTFQEEVVYQNLVGYIERGEIRPVVAKSYPLRDIVTAQQDFLAKGFTGKLVLVPPSTA